MEVKWRVVLSATTGLGTTAAGGSGNGVNGSGVPGSGSPSIAAKSSSSSIVSSSSSDGQWEQQVRHCQVLRSILEQEGAATVVRCPGHVAVVLAGGTGRLCLFDSLPQEMKKHHEDYDAGWKTVSAWLRGAGQQGSEGAAPQGRSPVSVTPEGLVSPLAVEVGSPFVRVWFEKDGGGALRLLAMVDSGFVCVWWWDSQAFGWREVLQQQVANSVHVAWGNYCIKHNLLLWGDDAGKVYSRTLRFQGAPSQGAPSQGRSKNSRKIEVSTPKYLDTLKDVRQSLAGRDGLWFLRPHSLHFIAFRSQLIHNLEIGTFTGISQDTEPLLRKILHLGLHPITQELVALDPGGVVFIISAQDKIKTKYLSTLRGPLEDYSKFDLFLCNNILGLVEEGGSRRTYCFDIKCGELLSTLELPPKMHFIGVCGQSPEGTFSIWGNCIAELQFAPLRQQVEQSAHHSQKDARLRPFPNCASSLCKSWGLEKWESKQCLDIIMSTQNEELKRKACISLLSQLQSPAMILALLSKTKSTSFIETSIQTFLSQYDYSGLLKDEPSGNRESVRFAARTSFHYHTPLNKSLSPLLHQYLKLSAHKDTSVHSKSRTNNMQEEIRDDFSKRRPGELEFLSMHHPDELKPFFEDLKDRRIQRTSGSIHLFNADESFDGISRNPNFLFEIMCRIYYELQPEELVNVVENVQAIFHRGSKVPNEAPQRSFFCRALLCLNRPLLSTSPNDIISSKVKLLCAEGDYRSALQLYLYMEKWEEAIRLMQDLTFDTHEQQLELFHVLLNYCMKCGTRSQFRDIWKFMPQKMSSLGLLDMVKLSSHPTGPSVTGEGILATNGTHGPVVGDFRTQLFKILSTETN